ncbi:MAG: hypothetical protein M1825_006529 [Sarcosagium campestre]|nr:MAG: hypothetical protein M1825_006529 [Sarcosagium campestre]
MDGLLATPPAAPHLFANARLSPSRSAPVSNHNTKMNSRKRKVEDDGEDGYQDRYTSREPSSGVDGDERMSASPAGSPAISSRQLIRPGNKRVKTSVTGRPLTLPRLLETLDAAAMRTVLRNVCETHPDIGTEVVNMAPRPTVPSALDVLNSYESTLRGSFPFGGNPTSDYAYNRVRQPLMDLLDALGDFTPHFLPPNETQMMTSLSFLDGATDIIHRLPKWDNNLHNHHKDLAYEEMSKAWALVVKEAAKRGGGIQLQYGGWDQKVAKHNDEAAGKMQTAVNELTVNLGWMGGNQSSGGAGEPTSIRQQLLSGTYGANPHVRAW